MKGLVPVLHELLNTDIGQGVLQHLHNDLVGHRGDVRAALGRVGHVLRAADAGGNDLGGNAVKIKDGGNILDDRDAVIRNIVQTSDEGADVGGSCLGGQKSLGRSGF